VACLTWIAMDDPALRCAARAFCPDPPRVDPTLFDYRPEGAAAARQELSLAPGVPVLTFVGSSTIYPTSAPWSISRADRPCRPRAPSRRPVRHHRQGAEALPHYDRPDLILTGFVDARAGPPQLSDYLSASDVVLVPLDSVRDPPEDPGGGSQRPAVVSTRIGAEGQAFVDGEEICWTDKVDQAFIDAALRLLADRRWESGWVGQRASGCWGV